MEGLLADLIDGFGTVAVVVVVFYFLLTGKLVLVKFYDQVLEERDMWRDIALRNASQADILLETKELGVAALESIKKEVQKGKQ